MSGSRYWCWGCQLWYGDASAPLASSKLCPGCKAARSERRPTFPDPEDLKPFLPEPDE